MNPLKMLTNLRKQAITIGKIPALKVLTKVDSQHFPEEYDLVPIIVIMSVL
jgi:hypothetical protein